MFEKLRIAYVREEIFGKHFKPDINNCYCITSKIFFNDKIKTDGTIDILKESEFNKEELWSYLYYLYYYNHTIIPIFINILNVDKEKSSAAKFYKTIIDIFKINDNINKEAKPISNETLIKFINYVILTYSKDLINPIFDYINILLKTNKIKMNDIKIKGDNIITDEDVLKNANVIVKLSSDNSNINIDKNVLFKDVEKEYTNSKKKDIYHELADIYGLGHKKSKILVEKNNIKSVEDLNNKAELLNEKQRIGLKYYNDLKKNIPHKEMLDHNEYILANILNSVLVDKFRRNKLSNKITVLIINNNIKLEDIINKLKKKYIFEILDINKKKCKAICKLPHFRIFRRIDLILVNKNELPFSLLFYTGPGSFKIYMKNIAKSKGYTLTENGLKKNGKIIDHKFNNEEDIFKFLNIKYVKPEDRK